MTPRPTDIFISGGGIAGLTAAAVLGGNGFGVVCADPARAPDANGPETADTRTTAFLLPARPVLEDAGIWPRIAEFATPLKALRVADAGGEDGGIRHAATFEAAEISDAPFGWNIPNRLVRRELLDRLSRLANVEIRHGVHTHGIVRRSGATIVRLSDGDTLSCRLLVGADGRNSRVRELLGIGARRWRYGQAALSLPVVHDHPHDGVSTEIHSAGGPFTLVPLPERDGGFSSAVVWVDRAAETERLSRLPDAAFDRELNRRSCGVLGSMSRAGGHGRWPVSGLLADRLTSHRSVLIAEAAHVVPPTGAQGLNMSFADIRQLQALLEDSKSDPGSDDVLLDYAKARLPDILMRTAACDVLNRASIAGRPVARDVRLACLKTLHAGAPLRRALMRAGLGRVR